MKKYSELADFYKGKKVLLTGHTGFKGSCMSLVLAGLGARVYGYALPAPTDPSLYETLPLGTFSESRMGDIRDFDALHDFYEEVQPEVVIHMAAQPIVRESYRIPRETFETNVMGTVNLLECVRLSNRPVSFLNVTTDKVYLNEEKPGYRYREDDPLDGFDPYSNSKSCSELATHSYAVSFLRETGSQISTARAGNVIGGGDWAKDRLIPDATRAFLRGEETVLRNPSSVRPFQHVFEPVFMYLDIACEQAMDPAKQGWYNVGPEEKDCVTAGELAEKFRAYLSGAKFAKTSVSRQKEPHEAGLLMLDNAKIKKVFGWRPVWDIDDAVKAAAQYAESYKKSPEEAMTVLMGQLAAYVTAWEREASR